MILGGVEVDVVGDGHRQVQGHVGNREHRGVGDVALHEFGDLPADLGPAGPALRHEGIEGGLREDVVTQGGGEIHDGISHPHSDPWGRVGGREHAVRQVLDPEEGIGGDVEDGHAWAP